MSLHVSYFEHLTYDARDVKLQHDRKERSLLASHEPVKLKFQAFGRLVDVYCLGPPK